MDRFAMLATMLAVAIAAVPAPSPAEAAVEGAVMRCRSPDGTIGYTDRNCAVFGAQAMPMDPELLARITSDQAHTANIANGAPEIDVNGFDPDPALPARPVPGRRSPASGCARNPAQLANDLEASVALGDVNRIAESYHFAGMSTAAGERVLDRLQRYAGRVVMESRYFSGLQAAPGFTTPDAIAPDAIAPDAAAWTASAGGPAMVRLVLAGDDGAAASSLDFDVKRYAGCYFVSFA